MTEAVAPPVGLWARTKNVVGESPGLVFIGAALAAALYWGWKQGGIDAARWPPEAILIVLLAAVGLAIPGVLARSRPAVTISVFAFLGFAGLSYLSILWATVPADAWDGANRTLLYATVYAAVAASVWRASAAIGLLVAFGVATAALGIGQFAIAACSDQPASYFVAGRFAAPTGYQNADAALFFLALWPLLAEAGRRDARATTRILSLSAAAALLGLGVLAQSRGSLVALPLSLVVFLVLSRRRVRALAFAAIPTVAAGIAVPWLLPTYRVLTEGGDVSGTLHASFIALVVSTVGAGVAGVACTSIDRRIEIPSATVRRIGQALVAVCAVLAVAGAVVAARHDAPGHISRGWNEFTHNETPTVGTSHLVAGLGSNRYDFWRVAWGLFERHPVVGVGADNFWTDYVRARRSDEEPRYPHSLELRTLSQTGVLGTALLLTAFGVPFVAAARRRRRVDGATSSALTAGLAMFVYWFVHGSVDWFWEIPALTVPALTGLAVAVHVTGPSLKPTAARTRGHRLVAVGLVVAAVAGCASLMLPWLAARNVELASASWGAAPASAFDELQLARRLNPLSDLADATAGEIAVRRKDWQSAQRSFVRAQARNESNWYTHLELAVVEIKLRRLQDARAQLARARALNPREPALLLVAAGISHPAAFDPASIDQLFRARAQARVGL